MKNVQQHLFELQDLKYREFQKPLLPNLDESEMIGVRVPFLRKYAKEFDKKEQEIFLSELPHKYHEEYLLHVILLSKEKDFSKLIALTEKVLPYINNWSVCDTFSPKIFRKYTDELLPYIDRWLFSDKEFTVRFAIEMLPVCS